MSFHSSQQTLSQSDQSENPFPPNLKRSKDFKARLNNPQSSQVRVFGREIKNITHTSSQLSNGSQDLRTNKPQYIIKSMQTHVAYESSNQVGYEENPSYMAMMNPNTSKSRKSLTAVAAADNSIISNYSQDSNMEVELGKENMRPVIPVKNDTEEEEAEICDREQIDNPQYVSEYATTIYQYLRENEVNIPVPDYLSKNWDINEKMRAILTDWLVDVHIRFKLLDETLFLTLNLTDRYLGKHQVTRQRLQLVGITALLIACKYEEIYSPEIKDFIYVTDMAYSREDILEMEGKILAALEFNLTFTSSLRFLNRYAQIYGAEKRTHMLARYLIELSLVEYKMLRYAPSNVAASALYLTMKIMKQGVWDEHLRKVTQYTEQEVRSCAKDLCVLLQGANRSSLQAVRKKFATAKFMEISKIQIEPK